MFESYSETRSAPHDELAALASIRATLAESYKRYESIALYGSLVDLDERIAKLCQPEPEADPE